MSGWRLVFGIGISMILSVKAASAFGEAATTEQTHFADADNRTSVILGKRLYAGHCGGCHGRNLQGQPLWQLADAYAGRRAPALDETGYTWQRSDEEMFHIVKYGAIAARPPNAMPAFEHELDDSQILAIIAFIKARWPIGLRILQALHNPASVGMPANADSAWQLPPNCNAVLRRSEAPTQSE